MKLKLSELKKLEGNPRTIKKEDLDKLTKSIEKFGVIEGRPFLVSNRTGENIIIGGNQRYEVCKKLGIKEVPVHIMEGLTEEEEKEIIIRDNISNGEWDWDILANEWDKEELEEWGLDVQFETVEPEVEEDDFEVDEGLKTDIVLGDLFEIGPHRLLCGDSTNIDDVNKLMKGEKADMVFTDPPYGMFLDTDYTNMPESPNGAKPLKHRKVQGDNDDFKPELISTIFSNFNYCKEIFIWGADYFAELIPDKNNGSWIVWDKRVDENFDKMIGAAFELCWSKGKHQRKIARINNTLFSGEKDAQNKVHPTQKPIKLATFFFNNWGKNNDLVADLFGGSGSTMVACHQLNRKCYMSELDPKYCETITLRMLKLDKELKINRNGIDVTEEWRKKL